MQVVSQDLLPIRNGTIVSTVVRLDGGSNDSATWSQASRADGAIVQVLRPGDTAVTVTQDDIDSLTITGGVAGQEVLIIAHSDRPVVDTRGT